MSFEKAYEEFKIYAQKRHKKQGFDTIVRNFDLHILPFFKGRKINELTKLDIIDWQSYILDKKFSNNFNRNLYYIFSSFMNYCVLYLHISENLVLQVEKFKKRFEQKQHIVYSIWQFRRFRFYLNNYVVKQYFNFMYFYGTRPSETMALRFCDLDGKFVCIRHSLQRKGQRNLDTPKNQSSFRTLKISPLTRFRIWLLKKSYYNCKNDYFIFGGNKPLSPTSVDRYKKRLVRKPD